MHTLSILRFGFALATACALSYLGCVVVMMTVPQETTIRFFNSLMHGVDVRPIIRWEMPWWEVVLGIVEVFVLGWLFGAIVASIYNVGVAGQERTPH